MVLSVAFMSVSVPPLPYVCANHKNRVMRKHEFCICKNKDTDQLRGTAKLISSFVYASRKPVFGVSDQVRHKPGCTATVYV